MSNIANKKSHDPEEWILERVEVDKMVEIPVSDVKQQSSGNNIEIPLKRNESQVRKRTSGVVPYPQTLYKRTGSTAARGLKSLRFLDRTVSGREADAWKAVERRFSQYANNCRLSKENFGACIGKVLTVYFYR